MKTFLCFLGLHKYKKIREVKNRNGITKTFYKCIDCGNKYNAEHNPYAVHACCCGSGREEGKCGCNMG